MRFVISRGLLVLISILSIALLSQSLPAKALPNEAYGVVKKVVDGDTFDVAIEKTNYRAISAVERIRIADVDSPEMDTAAGPFAKDFAAAVLLNKRVYLDIDDRSVRDPYGRLVCAVYLAGVYGQPIIAPCFNRMIVDSGHAKLEDFTNNEFDPSNWWPEQKSKNILPPEPGDLIGQLERYAADLLSQLSESQKSELRGWMKQAEDWLRSLAPR